MNWLLSYVVHKLPPNKTSNNTERKNEWSYRQPFHVENHYFIHNFAGYLSQIYHNIRFVVKVWIFMIIFGRCYKILNKRLTCKKCPICLPFQAVFFLSSYPYLYLVGERPLNFMRLSGLLARLFYLGYFCFVFFFVLHFNLLLPI